MQNVLESNRLCTNTHENWVFNNERVLQNLYYYWISINYLLNKNRIYNKQLNYIFKNIFSALLYNENDNPNNGSKGTLCKKKFGNHWSKITVLSLCIDTVIYFSTFRAIYLIEFIYIIQISNLSSQFRFIDTNLQLIGIPKLHFLNYVDLKFICLRIIDLKLSH